MQTFLLVGLGGFLGANARYWVGVWVADRWGTAFPLGTLLVNVIGSLVLAFFLTLASGRLSISTQARLFLATGFLGGFTTFSSFSYETVQLAEQSGWGAALGNVGANMILGLLAAILGVVAARWLQGGG